jgi:hypothetical protein
VQPKATIDPEFLGHVDKHVIALDVFIEFDKIGDEAVFKSHLPST